MCSLRLILGDQLSPAISALDGIDSANDVVLMVEVAEETRYVRHHRQKLVLILAAMRHFADELRDRGLQVDYVRLDDPDNTGSFTGELQRAVERHGAERVVATEPGEWRVEQMMRAWPEELGVDVTIVEDRRFLCSRQAFAAWAEGRKTLRMEYFYRVMRRRTGWLMSGDQPEGGRWNYDAENRKALPRGLQPPTRQRFEPDRVCREVMALVERRFPDHFGELDHFGWAVSRPRAQEALAHFITDCLPEFGAYQDAMKDGEDFLFHALLSPCLNIGLLEPAEVCEAAMAAYDRGDAPLAAVEGFLRQILGWREFVRGLYWLLMPEYATGNFLQAERPLPEFYWTAETAMNCMRRTIEATRRYAYAHHIQRLMVTGNFALLAGIDPAAVEEWYLSVYADAFEWVELPNTHGMALFADGGVLASKPYAASGAYINRMSDYCGGCRFDPQDRLTADACPFNYLYWNFLIDNEKRLRGNPRMGLAYRNLDRMPDGQRRRVVELSRAFLAELEG